MNQHYHLKVWSLDKEKPETFVFENVEEVLLFIPGAFRMEQVYQIEILRATGSTDIP